MRYDANQVRICEVGDCGDKYLAKGVCRKHYERLRRNGTLEDLALHRRTIAQTLEDKTIWVGECLVWIGDTNADGYGIIYRDGKNLRVHRVVWLEAGLPLKPRELLDHLCHVRACCNVKHLRAADHQKNNENRKGANKNSTTGVRGVVLDRKPGVYKIQVMHKRVNHAVRGFKSIEEASEAVEALRMELFEGIK